MFHISRERGVEGCSHGEDDLAADVPSLHRAMYRSHLRQRVLALNDHPQLAFGVEFCEFGQLARGAGRAESADSSLSAAG